MATLWSLFGVLFAMTGVFGLWLAWCNWQQLGWLWTCLGWALLACSGPAWAQSVGWEYGFVYSFLAMTLTAWVILIATRQQRPAKKNRISRPITVLQPLPRPSMQWPSKVVTFLLAGPLAAILSAFLVVCIGHLLPIDDVNQLAFSGFLLPIVWAILAVWIGIERRRQRQCLWYSGLFVASAVYLFG